VRHIASDLLRHAKTAGRRFEAPLLCPDTESRRGHGVRADRLFVFFYVSCWSRIETWMLFIRIFLLATNFCYSVTIDMLMGGYHIAVVGATGAAGTELLRVLERRSFPVASLRPIGSARSVGKSVQFCGDSIPVEKLDAASFEKIDIASSARAATFPAAMSQSRARQMPLRSTSLRHSGWTRMCRWSFQRSMQRT
jgi:Aspartate-semialdehyde dehydrogenase